MDNYVSFDNLNPINVKEFIELCEDCQIEMKKDNDGEKYCTFCNQCKYCNEINNCNCIDNEKK
jgi:hypothetical protein|tara:strand:+ start:709 stop:897 length:189 start_codon:yes stop_codon:yes gene_type:complete